MNNRVALVIGNSEYQNVGKLNNPKNDANDISSVLRKLNFDVKTLVDADLFTIQNAVSAFLKSLDEYAVGLFFYAGHGMQIDGKNYIIPIDLELGERSKTIVSCFCLDSLLQGVSSYKGKTFICILDACRDNPFTMGRGFSTGFAPFENPPQGTIIAYSTSTDCGAFDGKGNNGLYTQVLIDSMLIPNIKIEEMFKIVRSKVRELSIRQYGEEQLSWEYSSLVGDFFFSVVPQPVNPDIADDELYEYICSRQEFYENNCDNIVDVECLPYVDAYNKYHIPVIRILRAYSRVDYEKKGYQFSDATIDQLNIKYLTSWGFTRKYDRWYYKDNYVEMGDLLPLPEEMRPKEPIMGQEFSVEATMKAECNEGKIRFFLFTNIPEGTPLLFTLHGSKYRSQNKGIVKDSSVTSAWFSDKGEPINNGFYIMSVSSPIFNLLPESVQLIFGERNRNLYGSGVKYDPISGNTIDISFGILVKDNGTRVIDLQKKISEL